MDAPKSVEEIYEDFCGRRAALVAALTTDVAAFFEQCDPNKENLCLYGRPDGTWHVELPAEEVPPELPEPALGVNFARDGMARKDWLALVAVHSDAWLMAVAFYFAAKFDKAERARLFGMVNQLPTVYKALSGDDGKPGAAGAKKKQQAYPAPAPSGGGKRDRQDPECYEKPSPGRILSPKDNLNQLQGATIELYWPDDGLWYRAEILSLNPRGRSAKVLYSTGDVENLQLDEVINDGHLNVVRV